MQSYLINFKKRQNLKTDYILKKYYKNYKINDQEIHILFKDDSTFTNLTLFWDNVKITYIIADVEKCSSNFIEKIEEINSMIDDFERAEDVLLEINKLWKNKIIFVENKIEVKDKNHKEFTDKLETIKSNYIQNESAYSDITSKLFTFRSMIEMLGDQISKIYNDDRFDIELEEFSSLENINITLKNFNFNNSQDLRVIIKLTVSLNWIKNPPSFIISSNKILRDNILQVIEKLKPFSDVKSWSIKYSVFDTISNIHNMIDKYGEIHVDNPNEFETIINDLEYLFSIKNINISPSKLLELFDKELLNDSPKNKFSKNNYFINEGPKNNTQYWKKGTGYGHENANGNNWDIEQYVSNLNNKKKTIGIKMKDFIEKLSSDNITKYFDKVLELLQSYMNDSEVSGELVSDIANIIVKYNKIFNNLKPNCIKLIAQIKEYLKDNDINHDINLENNKEIEIINKIVKEKTEEKLDDFQKIFLDYKFKFVDASYKGFYYDSVKVGGLNIPSAQSLNNTQISRLQKEFIILKKTISINKDASIFFTVDKANIHKMRYIITGPVGTPYSYGLYIFDMTITNDFPNKPPVVNFVNNGNKRFNPNLYDCGKVCLSLLGTWNSSEKGEMWNSSTSTFNQLLISIQAQILIDEPYFNEPGHEKYIGKPHGIENSTKYNWNIRKYNLDHAINDLIERVINDSQYHEFKFIIRNYFKYHEQNIIKQNQIWYEEMPAGMKQSFKSSMDKFENLVNKL